jgi:DNA-binding NarL/FixJ family response regulator
VATAAALREIRPDVRILLVSGYGEEEVLARCGADPPAGFVQKPFTVEVLREKLREVVEWGARPLARHRS